RPLYLVAHAKTYEAALEYNELVQQQLVKFVAIDSGMRINSLAGLLSSEKVQKQRLDRWKEYWSPEKKQEVSNQLLIEGRKYGFNDHTFEAFFQKLDQTYSTIDFQRDTLLNQLVLSEYVGSKENLTTVLTTVHLTAGKEQQLKEIFKD